MIKIESRPTVGALVAANPLRARVFERYGIDYCCGGKIEFADACIRRGLNPAMVVEQLEAQDAEIVSTGEPDWLTAPLTELADHIVEVHHGWLQRELPRLDQLTEKVARVHGERDPRLIELRGLFTRFKGEMEEHTAKEEEILFPLVRTLESNRSHSPISAMAIARPILCMEREHEEAGGMLRQFRQLTDDYTPPLGACNTWRALCATLAELESETHVHVHQENSILFPRALTLAESLT
ncbi:iron-sulfur cluster repair di-iron protein [soil metagenome]